MAFMSKGEFNEWVGGASDEEVREMVKITKKRYFIFLLISLIPGVSIFTMGFAIFCYNNYCLLRSRGKNTGFNLWRWVMLLYGIIFIPLLVIKICAKSDKLGSKVLGI